MAKRRDSFKATIKRALEEIFASADDNTEEQAFEIFNRILPRTSFFRGIIIPINNLNKTATDISKAIKQLRNAISLSEAAKAPSITQITQQALPTWFKALIPGFQAAQQLSLNEIIEKLSPKGAQYELLQPTAKAISEKLSPKEIIKGTPQEPTKETAKRVISWPTAKELSPSEAAKWVEKPTKPKKSIQDLDISGLIMKSQGNQVQIELYGLGSAHEAKEALERLISRSPTNVPPDFIIPKSATSKRKYGRTYPSRNIRPGRGFGGKPGFIAPSASDFLGTDSILLSLVAAVLSSMGMAYVVPIVAIIKKILPKITGNLFGTKPESQTKKENTENLFDKISKVLSKTNDKDSSGGLLGFVSGFFKNTKFLKLVAGISILTTVLAAVVHVVKGIFNFVKNQREKISQQIESQRKLADLVPALAGAYAIRDVYKLRDQMQVGYGMQGTLRTEMESERYFYENTRQIHIAVENLKSFQRTAFNYVTGALLAPLNNIAGLLNRLLGFLGAEQDKEGLIVPPAFRSAMEDFISGEWHRQQQNNNRDPGPLGQ